MTGDTWLFGFKMAVIAVGGFMVIVAHRIDKNHAKDPSPFLTVFGCFLMFGGFFLPIPP